MTVPKKLIAKDHAIYASKCMDSMLGTYVGFQHRGSYIEPGEYQFKEKTVTLDKAQPSFTKNSRLIFATHGSIISKLIDPKIKNTPAIPKAKPKSPTLLTIKAFIAALFALSL